MNTNIKETISIYDLAKGDDYLALMLRLALTESNEQNSIMSTYGNRSAKICYENAKLVVPQLLDQLKAPLDRNPQLFLGATKKTRAKKVYESGYIESVIHGDLGFDQSDLSNTSQELSIDYYKQLENNREIHVLSVAATTELKVLLKTITKHCKIASVVIMGGTIKIQGNTGSFSEANFTHDPTANASVFTMLRERNIPTVLVPLDFTEHPELLFDDDRMKFMQDRLTDSPFALRMIDEIAGRNSMYGGFYWGRTKNGEEWPYAEEPYTGVPVHDATAELVQYDFNHGQELFEYAKVPISVSKKEGTAGVGRPYMNPIHVHIPGKVKDYDRLWNFIADSFKKFK